MSARNLIKSNITNDSDDHIYYDVIINHDSSRGNSPSRATFEETRTQSIIDNPNDFWLTIIRFTVPGYEIPIMIFPIASGQLQSNPDLSNLTVTLQYGSTSNTTALIYQPRILSVPVPYPPSINPPSYTQQISPYYYIYEYQHFIDIANTALNNSFTTLQTAVAPALNSAEAPYFIYDPSTQLISFISQTAFYDISLANPIKVFLNGDLFNFFQGIPVISRAQEYQIVVSDQKNNLYNPPGTSPATYSYYEIKQNFSALNNWNSFTNLVFLTNSIPVLPEFIPSSGTNLQVNSTNGNSNFRPILTDFSPSLAQSGDFRSTLQFYQAGPYRLINLLSDTPLRKFDVSVFWQDNFNNLYPVMIPPGRSVNIKFLFIKKNVYKTSLK
jgi:hypothetical protein